MGMKKTKPSITERKDLLEKLFNEEASTRQSLQDLEELYERELLNQDFASQAWGLGVTLYSILRLDQEGSPKGLFEGKNLLVQINEGLLKNIWDENEKCHNSAYDAQ